MLPSSSGLGYQPLTLGTPVQIRLGAPFEETHMQGYLIINTNEQGTVTTYTQYNMAVWTQVINEITEQRPDLCFEHSESPDPSGRYCGIIETFWRIAQQI